MSDTTTREQEFATGWPNSRKPGLRVQVDVFEILGTGPYKLSNKPSAVLMLVFFDGRLRPLSDIIVNPVDQQVLIAHGINYTNVQTLTLVYSINLEDQQTAGRAERLLGEER